MAETGHYIPHQSWKKEEEAIMNKTEISLVLDTYDDIFSDFDSRPYSHRALSDDFLIECKKASRDKPNDGFELNLMIPKLKRNYVHEAMIKKRLHEHFKKHHGLVYEDVRQIIIRGWELFVGGLIMMLIGAYMQMTNNKSFLFVFIELILEPGGWFLFWAGLDHLLFGPKKEKPELTFYEKMSKVKIQFFSY